MLASFPSLHLLILCILALHFYAYSCYMCEELFAHRFNPVCLCVRVRETQSVAVFSTSVVLALNMSAAGYLKSGF